MKRETITVKSGDVVIKAPAHLVASTLIAAALGSSAVTAPSLVPEPAAAIPALGEYWPGQGGHNAGLIPERNGVPDHYLIVAAKDIGSHEWGGRGTEIEGLSKLDGLANTNTLCAAETKHAAAIACAGHSADGHSDFYLPAAGELYHCWLHVAELFNTDCYYWSSSQRSAYNAFYVDFVDGYQDYRDKSSVLRVRPVRRLFI